MAIPPLMWNGFAGDIGGFFGRQIDHGGGDFLHLAHASQGIRLANRVLLLIGQHFGHRGLDEARRTALTVMFREATSAARLLVMPISPALAGGVIALAGIAGRTHDGC